MSLKIKSCFVLFFNKFIHLDINLLTSVNKKKNHIRFCVNNRGTQIQIIYPLLINFKYQPKNKNDLKEGKLFVIVVVATYAIFVTRK